ncbi:branched-chain amino acid aminotransferase [Acrasis kona]|uniref:Branched-chain-amino-acid aminotransferase n=1 Tax=Acrasis kona TaxID=1008807 RepID=A0AAW2YI34_9EUKA
MSHSLTTMRRFVLSYACCTARNSNALQVTKRFIQSDQSQAPFIEVPNTFHAKDLEHTPTKEPKSKTPNEKLVFGKQFTDHMLEVEWEESKGWGKPRIVPYHNLSLAPSCSALHYAIQCFEGMKAYTNGKEEFLFRPDMNAKRLNRSCSRLGLPTFNEEEFVKAIAKLVNVEREWIPKERGYSLYIRPTVISTEETLGVLPPKKALLYVIMSPVGPYFKTGFAAVKLLADPRYVRAFPGGTGHVKLGANYGPTILPQIEAAKKGYSQVLWLFGENHEISEVGTMNIFFYITNEKGEEELVTAPLNDTVLPGVTRDTIINITKNEWGMNVSERVFTMKDLNLCIVENRIHEAFGAGTACVVSPVKAISFKDEEFAIPVPEKGLAVKLVNHILGIQYGDIESPYRVKINDLL